MTTSTYRSSLALLAGVTLLCTVWPARLAAQADNDDAAQPANKPQPADKTADEVFAGVDAKLDSVDSLTCSVQQSIAMSGQRFLAAGDFAQATGNRMRLQYRIFPVRAVRATDKAQLTLEGGPEDTSKLKETGSLTQVSDGSVLWSYWVNGSNKQLTRRNVQEIVAAVSELPNETKLQNLESLGVGGLKAVMSQLQAGMEFGTVHKQQSGDTEVLILTGRWTKKTRESVFRLQSPDAALPAYLPDYVRVYVDAATMLPRRIQYLKRHPDPQRKQVRPLVTTDFRNIRLNGEVDPATFTFERPDDKDLANQDQDLTESIIANIKALATASDSTETPDSEEPAPANQE